MRRVAQHLIFTVFAIQTSCKPANVSSLQTLENFAAGREIHANACVGDVEKAKNYVDIMPPIAIEVPSPNLKRMLGDLTMMTLTALPEEYFYIARAVGTKIIITDSVDQLCNGRSDTEQQNVLKNPIIPVVEACYISAMGSSSFVGGMNIVVAANENAILRSLLLTFGYLISDIGGYGFNFGSIGNAPHSGQYFELESKLVGAFLEDMSSSKVFSISPTFDNLLGVNAGTIIANNIKRRATDSNVGIMSGLQANEFYKKNFFAHVVANSIDSAYCMAGDRIPYDDALARQIIANGNSQRIGELRNTRKIMRDFFPKTYTAFASVDLYLKRVGTLLKDVSQPQERSKITYSSQGFGLTNDPRNDSDWGQRSAFWNQRADNTGPTYGYLRNYYEQRISQLNRQMESAPSSVSWWKQPFVDTKQDYVSQIQSFRSNPTYIKINQQIAMEARNRSNNSDSTLPQITSQTISDSRQVASQEGNSAYRSSVQSLYNKVYNTGANYAELPSSLSHSAQEKGWIPTLRDGAVHAYQDWTNNISTNIDNRQQAGQGTVRSTAGSMFDNVPIAGQALRGTVQNLGILWQGRNPGNVAVYDYNKSSTPFMGIEGEYLARDNAQAGAIKNIEAAAFGKAVQSATSPLGSLARSAAPALARASGSTAIVGGISAVARNVTAPFTSMGTAARTLGTAMMDYSPTLRTGVDMARSVAGTQAFHSLRHQASHLLSEVPGETARVYSHHAILPHAGGDHGGDHAIVPSSGDGGHTVTTTQPHHE